MTQQEYDNLVQAVMSKESADRIMRERGLVVNGIPMNAELPAVDPSQAAVGQPQSQGSFAVPVAPTTPSSLSVRGPEDQSAYAKNTAILAALRSDPLGYISDVRGQQLGAFDERYRALTDPTSPQYRNRSQANWFNLAEQLMKPTMSGSVVENLGGAFGYLGSEAAKRQDLLAALQEKRAELAQKYDIAMLNAASDIQEKLIAAQTAANKPNFMVVPAEGQLVDVNLPQYSPDEAAAKAAELKRNPENIGKVLRFRDDKNQTREIVL